MMLMKILQSEYFKDQLDSLKKENLMLEESYKEALKSLQEDKEKFDQLQRDKGD